MKISNRGWIALSGGVVAIGAAALAGPLDPPAGPVTGTYKTLAQVEPRIDVATLPGNGSCAHIISQPGSYYLSGNLSVNTSGGVICAVYVGASDVSVDLNGFVI